MQSTIHHIQTELEGFYPEMEIRSFSYLIVEKLSGFSRTQVIVNKSTIFSESQRHIVDGFIENLKNFVPIQYILGETEFFGLTFSVNESVLIPRPETEELVDWICNDNSKDNKLDILDIGTGSGCIAIALKHKFQNATVTGFDISEKSLKTAHINAKRNNLTINFDKVDILKVFNINQKWNIIVSNPPYIPEKEKSEILPNVLAYEPHLALFVPDNDPLIFYRHIALFAQQQLQPTGKLYFEIHRDAGKACVDLLNDLGFHKVELRKDISGNDRMVKGNI
jgi:release factor glutamine methyltransferase